MLNKSIIVSMTGDLYGKLVNCRLVLVLIAVKIINLSLCFFFFFTMAVSQTASFQFGRLKSAKPPLKKGTAFWEWKGLGTLLPWQCCWKVIFDVRQQRAVTVKISRYGTLNGILPSMKNKTFKIERNVIGAYYKWALLFEEIVVIGIFASCFILHNGI